MAFSEAERVQIRKWLGFSPLYRDTNPQLESAISSINGLPDTEAAIRSYLTELEAIRQKIITWRSVLHGHKIGNELTADAVRATAFIRQEGRMYVGFICDALYTKVQRDVFSGALPAG